MHSTGIVGSGLELEFVCTGILSIVELELICAMPMLCLYYACTMPINNHPTVHYPYLYILGPLQHTLPLSKCLTAKIPTLNHCILRQLHYSLHHSNTTKIVANMAILTYMNVDNKIAFKDKMLPTAK